MTAEAMASEIMATELVGGHPELRLVVETGLVSLLVWFCWPDAKHNAYPKLRQDRTFQHVTCAVMFVLFFLWQAQAGVRDGLEVHFLGLTALSLMYGWRVAFLLTLPVAIALVLSGTLTLVALPGYLLISCFIPIALSYGGFLLSYRYLPHHLFVFIFVAGFFNAAITGSIHLFISGLYQWGLGTFDWRTIHHDYLSLIPLLAFPEGLLNGMALALLCVFAPQWLRSFSDRDYLYSNLHENDHNHHRKNDDKSNHHKSNHHKK